MTSEVMAFGPGPVRLELTPDARAAKPGPRSLSRRPRVGT